MIAATVAMAVKWIRVPYSVALVIVGLIIGVFHILPPIQMTPDLILLVFLPPLLFEASWNLPFKELKMSVVPISVLATLGVLISTIVSAGILCWFTHLDFKFALLLGAMVAATDPISVLAIFKQLRVDYRLSVLVEGESLLNDGTAVVLFKLILAAVVAGASISPASVIINSTIMITGGVLLGLAIGWIASKISMYFDDHLLETMLTTVVAYGAYLLAELIGVSGVIAVVIAGIVVGNYASKISMSKDTRLAVDAFWEYAAFAVNSLVFLLIGLQVKLDLLIRHGQLICIGILAVLVARALVVYGLCPFLTSKIYPINGKWRHVLFWGALRGSLSMAMALSLPENLPMREAIVISTFGIVLFTLLIPGLTMEPLIKRLKP